MDNKNNIIGIIEMIQREKPLSHVPIQVSFKKYNFLKMINLTSLYAKHVYEKNGKTYDEAKKDADTQTAEFIEFKKNNVIVSPLVEIYNSDKSELITMKTTVRKKCYGKKYDMLLWGRMDANNLTQWIVEKNRNTYELIESCKPRKVYFDFDNLVSKQIDFNKISESDELKGYLNKITAYLPNAKYSVSGGCGYDKRKKSFKLSLHIIVNNYHFSSKTHQNNYMKKFAVFLTADPAVYGSNQAFKMPNQSKMGEKDINRKQQTLIDTDYNNHIIQNINEKSILVKNQLKYFFEAGAPITKNKKIKSIDSTRIIKKTKYQIQPELKKPYIHKYHSTALNILKSFNFYDKSHVNYIVYNDYFFILTFCQLEGLQFDEVWEITKTRKSKYCKDYWSDIYNNKIKKFNEKVPKSKISLFRKSKRNKIFALLCQFYGEIGDIYLESFKKDQITTDFNYNKVIETKFLNLKDIANVNKKDTIVVVEKKRNVIKNKAKNLKRLVRKIKEQLIANDSEKDVVEVSPKYDENSIMNINDKIVIAKLGMGSGKTNNLNLLMRLLPNQSILSLCNRKSLCENQKGEFNRELNKDEIERVRQVYDGLFLKDGNNFTHYSEKNANDAKRLICEIESVSRFKNNKYDILIIDEIESLFLSFSNEKCHNNKYTDNWMTFIDMCVNCKKIFCLDAFISQRTIKFFKNILPNVTPFIISKKDDVIKKKIRMYSSNSYDKFMKQLKSDITANKKICFQYPYKSGQSSFFKQSIDDIKNLIQKYGNYKNGQVLNYHGDSDEQKKKNLQYVNDVWDKSTEGDEIMCVIYNGSISVGVNCNIEYDKLYITYSDHMYPRSTIQGSMRFRTFTDNLIECYCYKNIIFDDGFDYKCYIKPNLNFDAYKVEDLDDDEEDDFLKQFDIYSNAHKTLLRGIKKEYESKSFNALEWFFEETGYEITETITTDEKLNIKAFKDSIHEYIKDMKTNFDNYFNVEEITKKQYKRLLKIQKKGAYYTEKDENDREVSVMCSQSDRYKIKKYVVDQLFMNEQEYTQIYGKFIKDGAFTNYDNLMKLNKCSLFDKSYIHEGFKDVMNGYKCINMVINKNLTINNKKLTYKDKKLIELHYELGKNWKDKTDNIIKINIAKCHFLKKIVECNKKDNEHKLTFESDFNVCYVKSFIKYSYYANRDKLQLINRQRIKKTMQ